MEFSRITYSIKPSFAGESFCEIAKDPRKSTYSVFVNDENGHRWIQASDDDILSIFDAVAQLRLPVSADVCGLDGTTYELTFGTANKVTYSWWESLPKEWAELEKVVLAIEAISGITEQET
jgi:hypothetical protein